MEQIQQNTEAPAEAKRKVMVVFIDEDDAGPDVDLTPEQAKDALADLTSANEALRTKDTPVEMGKPFTEPFANREADEGRAIARKAIRGIASMYNLGFSNEEVEALVDLGNAFSPMFAAQVAEGACQRFKKHGCV